MYDGDASSTLLQNYLPMLACSSPVSPEWSSSVLASPCEGAYTVLDAKTAHSVGTPSSRLYNPYLLSGEHQLWPRGMPPVDVLQGEELCFSRRAARPLIQQGLIDGRPDVDPLRSARLRANSQQRQTLDRTTFSVVLPHNVMTPLNRCAQPSEYQQAIRHVKLATLYMFWASALSSIHQHQAGDCLTRYNVAAGGEPTCRAPG